MILELDQVTAMVGAQTHLYPTSLRLAPGAINVLLGVQKNEMSFERVADMSLARDALKLMSA